MKELAKRFIGEECIIYTITSNDGSVQAADSPCRPADIYTITSNDGSVQGLIKEIDDGGMVIAKNSGKLEIINLDFVTRIRQYPKKKNGKKRTSYWIEHPQICRNKTV